MSKGNKKKSTQVSNKLFKRILFLAVVLGYISFITFGSHGLITLSELNSEYNKNKDEIERLKNENVFLKKEIELTQSDPKKIEKIAREKYNMHKSGEKVFVIEKK